MIHTQYLLNHTSQSIMVIQYFASGHLRVIIKAISPIILNS